MKKKVLCVIAMILAMLIDFQVKCHASQKDMAIDQFESSGKIIEDVQIITCSDNESFFEPEAGSNRRSTSTSKRKQRANKKTKTQSQSLRSNRQELTNGPEWINGIWEVNTVISSVVGPVRVSGKLCINRRNKQLVSICNGSVVARGIYYVTDNKITCEGLYIMIDERNHRLEFGDGIYYRKVSDRYL